MRRRRRTRLGGGEEREGGKAEEEEEGGKRGRESERGDTNLIAVIAHVLHCPQPSYHM